MTFAQCRFVCTFFALFVRLSSAYGDIGVDKNGVPILWHPQKGLLFNPEIQKESFEDAAVTDELSKSFPEDNSPVGRRPHVMAFHAKHDASIAFSVGGRVQCILELERLFEERFFTLSLGSQSDIRNQRDILTSENDFSETWKTAVEIFLEKCECDCDFGTCPQRIHYAVLENFEHREFELLKAAVGPLLGDSVAWRFANHHHAHALLGFYTSPYRSAIIMSYDGGGNDGVFNFYLGLGLEVKPIANTPFNMGMAYNMIALLLPEVTGAKNPSVLCSDVEITPRTLTEIVAAMHELPNSVEVVDRLILGYAGKFMGYSALTNADPEVQFWSRQYIISYLQNETDMDEAFTWLRQYACRGTEEQRILAASTQAAWTEHVEEIFWETLLTVQGLLGQPVDGIVLTGGCSLNVLANQRIFEKFTERATSNPDFPRSLFVPPGSNDGGIVVGSLWSVMPPLSPQPLQYLGFRLFDEDSLEGEAASREAQRLSQLGGIEYLADLLAGKEAWNAWNEAENVWNAVKNEKNETPKSSPIIAVVIGRQEFGPRALGHRSLLAVPSYDMKDRMNQLKVRQSYRPVAPMIADEALEQVFGQRIESPYMTMAPKVLPNVRENFPGLAHVDGTARHQSVGAKDEPWIHALLLAVGRKTGLAALINTSFNSKGKPIVNTVRECLKMLDELPDLDFVLIEDWLFRKRCCSRDALRESQTRETVETKHV
eukprot:Skav212343  [mRNA]  locus=scaffold1488:238591:240732:+ [translate_table: standard]